MIIIKSKSKKILYLLLIIAVLMIGYLFFFESTQETIANTPQIDSSHPMAQDLRMYLNFHEESGSIIEDITNNGHDAAATGGQWTAISGESVWSKRFGEDDFMTVTNHADLNFLSGPFSVGMVIAYDDVNNNWNNIFDKGWDPGYHIAFPGWGDSLALNVGDVESIFGTVGIKGNLSNLYSVVMVVTDQDDTVEFYVNGSFIDSASLSSQTSEASLAADLIMPTDTGDLDFEVYYNKAAIWGRALSAQEISDWHADKDIMLLPLTPETPILHNLDGTNQIAFNNARISSTTPTFRTSAIHAEDFDRFQIELNTQPNFQGTSYTETFSGTFSSGTQYNLQTTSTLNLPSTDGVTYYVRVRASSDAGINWSNWSTDTWSYTYQSSGDADWFQQTDAQFNTGTLSDTRISGSNSVQLIEETGEAVTIFLTSGSSWTVPSDWNNFNNTIEVIGAGGGGGKGTEASTWVASGGGGGGAYASISNANLTPNGQVSINIGNGGSGATTVGADGGEGGDTYLCDSTSNCGSLSGSSVIVGAEGGGGGLGGNSGAWGGDEGSSENSIGSIRNSGGKGGDGGGGSGCCWNGGGGGGGAAGPHGNGGQGGDGMSNNDNNNPGAGGGGGGGADGGSNGGGGGNYENNAGPGGDGESIWIQTSNSATAGPGGGGGGSGSENTNSTSAQRVGGLYGGGGGGTGDTPGTGNGGDGQPGIIVITYAPILETLVDDGTIMSPEIDINNVLNKDDWGQINFSTDETNGEIKMRLYYTNSTPCDTLISDTDLAGNSAGFNVSQTPIDISTLDTITYSNICMEAELLNDGGTPFLLDWSISWDDGVTPTISITIISNNTIEYGNIPAGNSRSTHSGDLNNTVVIENDGTVTVDLNIIGQDTACPWTLSSGPGVDEYVHQFCKASDDDCTNPPTNYTNLTTEYQLLYNNVTVSSIRDLDLNITTPSTTSCFDQQSVDVTIQAVEN